MFKFLAQEYVSQYGFLNLFNFITFRVGASILTSLFFSLIFGQFIINKLSKIKNKRFQKILILGEMNELGLDALKFHSLIVKEITKHMFDNVILSGDLFKKALKMFPNSKNKFIYKSSSKGIMAYLVKNLHKKAMIMTKCSNATEVNKFANLLKSKKKDKIV